MTLDTLKLYEINDKLRQALETINDIAEITEGEVPEKWAAVLDDILLRKDKKVLDIGRYIKSLKAQSVGIKAEIDKLLIRLRINNAHIDRLTWYLTKNINTDEKYKDNNTVVSFRRSSKVEITDENKIPSNYLKTEVTIMRALIKKDIKSGITIDGASVIPSYTLNIK